MFDYKISAKSVLLIIYFTILLVVGVIFVPCSEIQWGDAFPSKVTYRPIFLLSNGMSSDGHPILYVIQYARLLYTLGIATLLAAVIWVLLSVWEKEDQRHAEMEAELEEQSLIHR